MATQSHKDGGSNVRNKKADLWQAYGERDRIRKSLIGDGDEDSRVFVLGWGSDDPIRMNVLLDKITPTAVELLQDERYKVREYGDDCVLIRRHYGDS